MEPDENVNHVRGNLLAMVLAEDLDPLSVDELTKRIAALEGEIARCRARDRPRQPPPGQRRRAVPVMRCSAPLDAGRPHTDMGEDPGYRDAGPARSRRPTGVN
ncbi:DUF1192 family protein [Sphingomonas hankookensis]|uniref:DUF1192 family protein n=1 Tax=Sphingomonas hankookensis TaxID=563996 RepID=UPI003D303DB3